MILPIVAYGHPTLRKVAENIDKDYPELDNLISDMWETMYAANGIGLAAPQVNRSIRLFVVDATVYKDEYPEAADFKKIFINAIIEEELGEEVVLGEGCLSLPGLHEDVSRKPMLRIRYLDEKFDEHIESYDGFLARVIQHEYDHIEGVLYVDRISAFRRMLLKGKLRDISNGDIDVDYRMIFPNLKRKLK